MLKGSRIQFMFERKNSVYVWRAREKRAALGKPSAQTLSSGRGRRDNRAQTTPRSPAGMPRQRVEPPAETDHSRRRTVSYI